MSTEDFLLKWNDHHKLFFAGAEEILDNQEFTDVTLSAGDKIFQAHKFVLSICSPYFQGLFRKLGPEKHVIFLKDISPAHLELLLQYMYRGEIKVRETELVTVLNVAQSLEVRGLTDNSETNKHEPEPGKGARRVSPPPPPPPSQRQSGVKRPGLSTTTTFSSTPAPVVKQELGGQTVIDLEQEQSMEPVAPGGYLGQSGDQIYAEENSMVAAGEGYEGYEEYEGEEYYQEGLGAGAENRAWLQSMSDSDKTCPYCGKVSGTHKDLQKHLLIHSTERPYPCRICDKSFKDPSNRLKHERQIHGHDYRNVK